MGAIIPILAIGAAVAGVAMMMGGQKQEQPQLQAMPQTPEYDDAQDKAKDEQRQRRLALEKNKTLLTSPLGDEEEAPVEKSALTAAPKGSTLGQGGL